MSLWFSNHDPPIKMVNKIGPLCQIAIRSRVSRENLVRSMRFKETCHHCRHQFYCDGGMMLREDRRCPQCGGPLPSASDKTKQDIIHWGHVHDTVMRLIVIKREFGIRIYECDYKHIKTFGDVHNYLLDRLDPNDGDDAGTDSSGDIRPEAVWNRLCTALRSSPEVDCPVNPTRDDRFVTIDDDKIDSI